MHFRMGGIIEIFLQELMEMFDHPFRYFSILQIVYNIAQLLSDPIFGQVTLMSNPNCSDCVAELLFILGGVF